MSAAAVELRLAAASRSPSVPCSANASATSRKALRELETLRTRYGAEAAPVVDAVANAAALKKLEVPRLPCPECSTPMELGDFPERYLSIFQNK